MKIKPSNHRFNPRFFFKHFARNLLVGFVITTVLLVIGMIGFCYFEKTEWIDAYADVTMIISGVGILNEPKTSAGKIFVGTYSLLGAGLYLIAVGIAFAPVFHWLFRHMHVEDREHNI